MRALPISLTFDLDPDVFDESIASSEGRTRLTWRCIEESIPMIREAVREVAGRRDLAATATWFVRVDNQIRDFYGRPAHLLTEYASLFGALRDAGEEIAWHPHLYRETPHGWVQETDDSALDEAMEEALADMRSVGYAPVCSRIGEAFGSAGIMAALDRLGIVYDSTAMPGRRRVDDQRTIDWQATPPHPYRPSRADHRRPGQPAFGVVEIPMSMLSVRAAYDREPVLRYLDLSFRNAALAAGLPELLARADYLVTVTHPSAVLPDFAPDGGHGLLSFDVRELATNLAAIVDAARGFGREPRFVTLAELGATMAGGDD